MKFAGGCVAFVVKNHTGSVGSYVTSAMSQVSASPNNATPRNSLIRRDSLDSTSDLHEYGQHQRTTARALLEEAPQLDADALGHQTVVGALFQRGGFEQLLDDAGRLLEQALGLAGLDDVPARNDLGRPEERARLLVDRDDGHHEAVRGQVPPVAQHLVADLADTRHVYEHAARRRLALDAAARRIEADDIAILGEEHFDAVRRSGRHPPGHPRVPRELAVFAVDRNEVPGTDQREHQLQLLLAAVPRHVDVLDSVMDDVGPAPGHVVDHARDRLLVARNGTRREHHGVVGPQLHVPVVVDRDPRVRRLRLALRSGREAQDLVGRVALDLHVADLHACRNPEESEPLGRFRVLNHAAADQGDHAIELRGEIDEDLHPVDARGERRDHELASAAREDLLERLDDLDLRAREALAFDVRAVGKQRQHPPRAELGEPVQVEVLTVDRRLIDLEVAGVDDRSD